MLPKDINRMELIRRDSFGVDPSDPHRSNYHIIMQLYMGEQPILEAQPVLKKTLSFTTRLERDAVWSRMAEIFFCGRPEGVSEVSFTRRGESPP